MDYDSLCTNLHPLPILLAKLTHVTKFWSLRRAVGTYESSKQRIPYFITSLLLSNPDVGIANKTAVVVTALLYATL